MTPDRVDLFEADVAASPSALERLLDAYSAADAPLARVQPGLAGDRRIVFTGLGSSRYAALVVASYLRATGATAWVEYASTRMPTEPADDLVLVAISASGRTREVVDAARRHRGRSLTIGVTNVPDSPLASEADHFLPLLAGEETSGIACRTFRATVAVLAMLSGAARPDELRPTVDALRSRIDGRAAWLGAMADALDGAPSIDVIADASLLGLAEQTALMLREAPRLPARAHDTGDWLHTAVYLALPGHRALLFEGAAADAEVVATIERRGGEVGRLADDGSGPLHRAIVESVIGEFVAAELWRRVSVYGLGDAVERGPDLADPPDRLEVERVAEDEDHLADADRPVPGQVGGDLLR